MVVGWTDPEGSRSHIGALLLGYYTDDGRLHYAGDSALIDPWGETLAQADASDRVLTGDVDPRKVAEARTRFPVLEDVRMEAYKR